MRASADGLIREDCVALGKALTAATFQSRPRWYFYPRPPFVFLFQPLPSFTTSSHRLPSYNRLVHHACRRRCSRARHLRLRPLGHRAHQHDRLQQRGTEHRQLEQSFHRSPELHHRLGQQGMLRVVLFGPATNACSERVPQL